LTSFSNLLISNKSIVDVGITKLVKTRISYK